MAQESNVLPLTDAVLPQGMKMLDLPGHCFEMTGFLTPDGTAYIADSVSSPSTLAKYGIGYLWDAEASLQTLAGLPDIPAKCFVPSHADVVTDIRPLAELNAESIRTVQNRLIGLCRVPVTFEEILQQIFNDFGLQMSAQQYVLIGSTIRSYLSGLYTQGQITCRFENNRMLWQTTNK